MNSIPVTDIGCLYEEVFEDFERIINKIEAEIYDSESIEEIQSYNQCIDHLIDAKNKLKKACFKN